MPKIEVVFYREVDGSVPIVDWLEDLGPKAQDKCLAALRRLAALGHELRRPIADYLRDGIYELRVGYRGVNYRILYFFHGRTSAVVSHGIVKERVIPPRDIDRAVARKRTFEAEPQGHTFNAEDIL